MAGYRLYMSISYDCCSSVAYGTRAKIQNTITQEIYDFTEQPGEAVYSQTYLCSNAPKEWKDPAVLWNEVAKVEKASDARQARTFVGNLPAELADKPEEMQKIVDEVGKGFAEDGMCCTISIHKPDADSDNWHWHAECTLRKVDKNGKFEPKSKKIYEYEKDEFGNFVLDKDGNQIKMVKRDKNGKPKRDKGGHIIYVCHKENLDNGWSTEKKLLEWRKRYEEIENRALERNGFDVRVSCERYTKQGCILPPLPRLSVKDWNLKKEGGTNEAIEEWRKVEAERQRIREEFPQMFDEKGRQKVSLDVAIAALEEQKAQIEKEMAEEQQRADERVIGEAAPEKIPEETPTIREEELAKEAAAPKQPEIAEKQTETEKTARENASQSSELPEVEHITPTEQTRSSAEEQQPETEQKELKEYAVLLIRDAWDKITGYLHRACSLLEPVKAEEKPADRVEEHEDGSKDTYKYYEDPAEATEALYLYEDEAKDYNATISKEKQPEGYVIPPSEELTADFELVREKVTDTAKKAVSGIKSLAGSVADKFNEIREARRQAAEQAAREAEQAAQQRRIDAMNKRIQIEEQKRKEALKGKTEKGYIVTHAISLTTAEETSYISERYTWKMEEDRPKFENQRIGDDRQAAVIVKTYCSTLEDAEKLILSNRENAKQIGRITVENTKLRALRYPLKWSVDREGKVFYDTRQDITYTENNKPTKPCADIKRKWFFEYYETDADRQNAIQNTKAETIRKKLATVDFELTAEEKKSKELEIKRPKVDFCLENDNLTVTEGVDGKLCIEFNLIETNEAGEKVRTPILIDGKLFEKTFARWNSEDSLDDILPGDVIEFSKFEYNAAKKEISIEDYNNEQASERSWYKMNNDPEYILKYAQLVQKAENIRKQANPSDYMIEGFEQRIGVKARKALPTSSYPGTVEGITPDGRIIQRWHEIGSDKTHALVLHNISELGEAGKQLHIGDTVTISYKRDRAPQIKEHPKTKQKQNEKDDFGLGD